MPVDAVCCLRLNLKTDIKQNENCRPKMVEILKLRLVVDIILAPKSKIDKYSPVS